MFMRRGDAPTQRACRETIRKDLKSSLQPTEKCGSVRANMNLTARQQEVLDYITRMQATAGVVPSTREIQEFFGFASQTAAVNHLRALEKKGIIQRQPGKARAVAVVSQLRREPIVDVPIYGTIAAGFAEATEQQEEDTISIDASTL